MNKSITAIGPQAGSANAIQLLESLPFFAVHLVCFAAIFTGVSWGALGLCISLHVIRMFGITAGYHRYFAHTTSRTSRLFPFVSAWIGGSAVTKVRLGWTVHH